MKSTGQGEGQSIYTRESRQPLVIGGGVGVRSFVSELLVVVVKVGPSR